MTKLTVLTACNEVNKYISQIPYFIKFWTHFYPEFTIKIILILDSIPINLQKYIKYLILFKPIPNVSTCFTAQYIRILYPSILDTINPIVITDIDMFPLNNTYFYKITDIFQPDKVIINFLNKRKQMIAIAYTVAEKKLWKKMNNIENIQDIRKQIINKFNNIIYIDKWRKSGWFTDQKELYNLVKKLDTSVIIDLSKTVIKKTRLTRNIRRYYQYVIRTEKDINKYSDKIKDGYFDEYQPVLNGKKGKINDKLFEILDIHD